MDSREDEQLRGITMKTRKLFCSVKNLKKNENPTATFKSSRQSKDPNLSESSTWL